MRGIGACSEIDRGSLVFVARSVREPGSISEPNFCQVRSNGAKKGPTLRAKTDNSSKGGGIDGAVFGVAAEIAAAGSRQETFRTGTRPLPQPPRGSARGVEAGDAISNAQKTRHAPPRTRTRARSSHLYARHSPRVSTSTQGRPRQGEAMYSANTRPRVYTGALIGRLRCENVVYQ